MKIEWRDKGTDATGLHFIDGKGDGPRVRLRSRKPQKTVRGLAAA
jgi:hypothetical protein